VTPRETEGVRAISVRFRAGDDVCGGLAEIVAAEGAHGAVVVSAVGSLSEVSYVLATLGEDGRTAYTDELRVEGTIELLGLQGHFGRTESGEPAYHLHGSFGLEDGEIFGGHVLGARVLVTLEATLLVGPGAEWRVVPYLPDQADQDETSARPMNVFVPGTTWASE
jgi:predicted DNA-binding protein with PD1-like motif